MQVTNGVFQPGQRIIEKQLEQQRTLSKTPIREAFIEQASEGILIAELRKGYRVNAQTLKRTHDLYEMMGL